MIIASGATCRSNIWWLSFQRPAFNRCHASSCDRPSYFARTAWNSSKILLAIFHCHSLYFPTGCKKTPLTLLFTNVDTLASWTHCVGTWSFSKTNNSFGRYCSSCDNLIWWQRSFLIADSLLKWYTNNKCIFYNKRKTPFTNEETL